MVNGVVLLVDAAEGPLPQTRFVLSKTLEKGLDIVILINKIDRDDARPAEVYDEILDLLIDLGADEKYLESPLIYANGRAGIAKYDLEDSASNLNPLMDTIIEHIAPPSSDPDAASRWLLQTWIIQTIWEEWQSENRKRISFYK